MKMELIFTDNLENILALIKNNPNSIFETFEFFEKNFNEILLQRLCNNLKEREIDISSQLSVYHLETLYIEENLLVFQSELSIILDAIIRQLEKGNYDLYDWTVRFRDRLTKTITTFNVQLKQNELKKHANKLYSKLLFNGLNSKKFEMITGFMDTIDSYCKTRRIISVMFDTYMDGPIEDIQKNKDMIAIKLKEIFRLLEMAYSQINNKGILKMSFLSKDTLNENRKDIICEIDNLVSVVFKSFSENDIDLVKQGLTMIRPDVKAQLKQKIVGMDKSILAESMSLEGVFYRAVRYANQL
jgi:hypothetical protein